MLDEIKAKIEKAFYEVEEFEKSESPNFEEAYFHLKDTLKEILELTKIQTVSFIVNQ